MKKMKKANYFHPANCPICKKFRSDTSYDECSRLLHEFYDHGVCNVCLNEHRDPLPWTELFRNMR